MQSDPGLPIHSSEASLHFLGEATSLLWGLLLCTLLPGPDLLIFRAQEDSFCGDFDTMKKSEYHVKRDFVCASLFRNAHLALLLFSKVAFPHFLSHVALLRHPSFIMVESASVSSNVASVMP